MPSKKNSLTQNGHQPPRQNTRESGRVGKGSKRPQLYAGLLIRGTTATHSRIGNRLIHLLKHFALYSIFFAQMWTIWTFCPFAISSYIHTISQFAGRPHRSHSSPSLTRTVIKHYQNFSKCILRRPYKALSQATHCRDWGEQCTTYILA